MLFRSGGAVDEDDLDIDRVAAFEKCGGERAGGWAAHKLPGRNVDVKFHGRRLFGGRCQRHSLPLPNRAGFGGHADFCPGRAAAFAAAAGVVQCSGVPLGACAAGGFAGGEDVGWRWREPGGSEAAGSGHGAAGLSEEWRRGGGCWRDEVGAVLISRHALLTFRKLWQSAIFAKATRRVIERYGNCEFAGHDRVMVHGQLIGKMIGGGFGFSSSGHG